MLIICRHYRPALLARWYSPRHDTQWGLTSILQKQKKKQNITVSFVQEFMYFRC